MLIIIGITTSAMKHLLSKYRVEIVFVLIAIVLITLVILFRVTDNLELLPVLTPNGNTEFILL
jgi:hypothetical protein